jgi:PST family polysaccharide transporter
LFVLVFFLKSDGVFYALTLSQFLFFIFIFLFDKSLRSYIFSIDFKWFDSVMIKALLSFSAITLSTAIIAPVSQLLIRNALIDWAGVFSSGIWQSVLRVSEGYMLLFSTIILYVYMPTINSKKSNNELLKHLYEVFIPLALFVILIFVSLIILRQEIFILLYSKEFVKGADWIVYQIVGDFFKILSYSLIYVLIAKGRFKFFVLVELFFAAIEVGVSFVLIKNDFDNGPVMAHLFTMVLLFIFLVISRKKIINI